ncbi:MAG: hydantoinase B/oxoprolinase family protein, partial [Gammaproteobacteria bacterium]
AELLAQGATRNSLQTDVTAYLTVPGTDNPLPIELGSAAEMTKLFTRLHQQHFGFVPDNSNLIIESLRVDTRSNATTAKGQFSPLLAYTEHAPKSDDSRRIFTDNEWHAVPVYRRTSLSPGAMGLGPAIIVETTGTVIVEPGWQFTINPHGQLVLQFTAADTHPHATELSTDPILLEVFNNRFTNIAEQMGVVLESTARSVNIRERLDFSCALFDAQGQLVANAPHIPVHLGSMDDSVQAVLQDKRVGLLSGNSYATNNPYKGGTHLPDITVVSPVLDASSGELIFIVASRAHHADIGGRSPGSMPPLSQHISEEGVLFDNCPLLENEIFRTETVRAVLEQEPWPARNVEQNIADLKAQLAANARGIDLLRGLIGEVGSDQVLAYTAHVQDNAEHSVRAALTSIESGSFEYALDNGEKICVAIDIDQSAGKAVIDFSGTSAQSETNFNAPSAVCHAAVLYVFRTLVDADIPLNAGCGRALTIKIPDGSMLNPQHPAAVVAGNVETSQCIVDALFGALGLLAGSQGTMNNLSFGNNQYQYYETICGGSGAGTGFHGTDAVQTHMTNSRLTDPEILETRFPVRIEEFAIRPDSGGKGAFNGGNGAIRSIRFLDAMRVGILANRRTVAPFGLHGGGSGKLGTAVLTTADGKSRSLGGVAEVDVKDDDVLTIKTPGGGGYGKPPTTT